MNEATQEMDGKSMCHGTFIFDAVRFRVIFPKIMFFGCGLENA